MGQMSVMGKRGDSVITWDPKVKESTESARNAFDVLVHEAKMTPYKMTEGGNGKSMKEFDPEAREIVFAPPMTGG